MNRLMKRSGCALLALLMLLCGANVPAAGVTEVDSVVLDTGSYICNAVKNPQVGSVGGEWAILGLARSEYDVPDDYYQNYYEAVEGHVTACNGVLHARKYTEYSRVIIALTSIEKDPTDVGGYNLLTALGDYDKTVWQGLNGPMWALIALDCGSYAMPQNPDAKTQATRDMYVDYILDKQLSDGGFSLTGRGGADPSITAMALQALAKYTERNDVASAVENALTCLSAIQDANGGFLSGGTETSESCAQVIMALCALGVSLDDARFSKNGNTLMDNLLSFHIKEGGFAHTADASAANQMATEQSIMALAAFCRTTTGQSGLYEMNDLTQSGELCSSTQNSGGEKHALAFYYWKNAPVWGERAG